MTSFVKKTTWETPELLVLPVNETLSNTVCGFYESGLGTTGYIGGDLGVACS